MDTLKIEQNAKVEYRNNVYTISHVLGLENVLLRNDFTGEKLRVTISELRPISNDKDKSTPSSASIPLEGFSEKQWEQAEKKFSVIEPLLDTSNIRTFEDVSKIAESNHIAPSTIYRWISLYEATGRLSSLIPSNRNDKGKTRINEDAENLIREVIESHYLQSKKISISQAYEKLKVIAKRLDITPPSKQTFTRRVNAIKKAESTMRRESIQEARTNFSAAPGKYDEATFPLSIVQIDHTPVDLMFVDEDDRESIGRAWLTVAICVFSRMVCGYHLSYEPPSAMSVGQCLINSILPKEQWLQERSVDTIWPIWGIMSNLHADNGKDFRSKSLDRSCQEYGININWRPLGRADFGGHIERLLGTFNKDIHQLEGSTFSNIQKRGSYKSEQRAIFTLEEFDRWLCTYITKVYHQSLHSGINMSPLAKLEEGYMGTDDNLGVGLPGRIVDENRLRMDFLPVVYRSVQRYGIEIDHVRYYSTAISKWIREKNPDPNSEQGKFVIKRDPRDVSKVYFLDPDINEYLEVPCVNRGAPSITLWELREINRKLKESGQSSIDEDLIFKAREELILMEESAKKTTKRVRRKAARAKEASKVLSKKKPSPTASDESDKKALDEDVFSNPVTPFDDIRDSS